MNKPKRTFDTTCFVFDVSKGKVLESGRGWQATDKLTMRHFMLDGREYRTITLNEAMTLDNGGVLANDTITGMEQE